MWSKDQAMKLDAIGLGTLEHNEVLGQKHKAAHWTAGQKASLGY